MPNPYPFLLTFFLCISLQAQVPLLRNYTAEDGLPSSETYDILQDRHAYLWIATDHGVSRYNGYEFENFTTGQGLTDNTVFQMQEDRQGRIWFLSFNGGLSYFEKDSIYAYPYNHLLRNIDGPGTRIYEFYISHDEALWINTGNFIRIDSKGRVERKDRAEPGFMYSIVRPDSLYRMARPLQVEASFYPMVKTSPEADFLNPGIKLSQGNLPLTCVRDKDHWVFADNTVMVAILKDKVESRLFFPHSISGMYAGKENRFWVYMKNGGATLMNASTWLEEEHFLEGLSVDDVYEDHEGNTWFATLEQGIYMLPASHIRTLGAFQDFRDVKANHFSYCDGQIYTVSGAGNIYHFDPAKPSEVFCINKPPTASIEYCSCDSSGDLWVSDIELLRVHNFKVSDRISMLTTKQVSPSRNGAVWAAGISGFVKIKDGKVIFDSRDIGFVKRTTAIAEDPQTGKIYIGTLEGLYVFDGNALQSESNFPALQKRITYLHIEKDGTLWVATRGNGLVVKHGERYFQVTDKEGLAGNMIRSMLIDRKNNAVWLGTNKGIDRIAIHSLFTGKPEILHLDTRDGLPASEINDILTWENQLFVATAKGIARADLNKLARNAPAPPLYITRVVVNQQVMPVQSQYTLKHDQQQVTFHFLALAFRDRGDIKYRYRLRGLEQEWLTTTARSVRYTSLPPGDYAFQVQAFNRDGKQSSLQVIKLHIGKHFTQTWWFTMLIILVLVIGTGLIAWLIFRQQKRKNDLQRQFILSEHKALRSQVNPHFVFNALNSIQSFVSENDKVAANVYLSKFAMLMRRSLENSKMNFIPLMEELAILSLYLELEQLRFGDRLKYEVISAPSLSPYLPVPPMILQPFIENAIWHGLMPKEGAAHLQVELKQEENLLYIRIEDDGIGRKRSAEINSKRTHLHHATGMQNVNERIRLLNELYSLGITVNIIDLENNTGTRVEIRIPLEQENNT